MVRYHLIKALLGAANKLNDTPARYGFINNVEAFDRDYLESFRGSTVDDVLDEQGFVDVTDENAQEVIDDLQAAVDLAEAKREEKEVFSGR
jgi:hypothetical protein